MRDSYYNNKEKLNRFYQIIEEIYSILQKYDKRLIQTDKNNFQQKIENLVLYLGIKKEQIEHDFLSYLIVFLKNNNTINKQTDTTQYFALVDELKTYLNPQGNDLNDIRCWLWDSQIRNVLEDLELEDKHFKFLGVSYVDFDKYVILQKQIRLLPRYLQQNYTRFGIVYNLSNANTNGSHWVSLFIDFDKDIVFYFDSVGQFPKEKVTDGGLLQLLQEKEQVFDDQVKEYIRQKNYQIENNNQIYKLFYYLSIYGKHITDEQINEIFVQDKENILKTTSFTQKDNYSYYKGKQMVIFINTKNIQKIDGPCGIYSIYTIKYFNKQKSVANILSIYQNISDEIISKQKFQFFSNFNQIQQKYEKKKMNTRINDIDKMLAKFI